MKGSKLGIVIAGLVLAGCASIPPGEAPTDGLTIGNPGAKDVSRGPANRVVDPTRPNVATAIAVAPTPRAAKAPLPVAAFEARDLLERIRLGFAMPDLDSSRVTQAEAWYRTKPERFNYLLDRARPYLYHVVQEVQRRGMPTEVALLPMIESAYNPKAYSRSHAAGLWQFIPGTGRDYGLKQNNWVDDRRDVIAATTAALNYLEKLYKLFGSWDLAFAAYNCGEGCVQRAIEKQAAAGLPTDYLSLPLPEETRQYVPKLIAVKHIIQNPAAFNITLRSIPNREYFREVAIKQHLDVKDAAKLAEMPVAEFVALNPSPKREVIPEQTGKVVLPVAKAEKFEQNMAKFQNPLASWRFYRARRGENVTEIAKRARISPSLLAKVNQLPSAQRISEDQQILVPELLDDAPISLLAQSSDAEETVTVAQAPRTEHSIVRRNRNQSLARKDATPPWPSTRQQQLAQTASSAPAQELPITTATATEGRHHVVAVGDTLFNIGRRYSIPLSELRQWNGLEGNTVRLGQKIMVAAPLQSDGAAAPKPARRFAAIPAVLQGGTDGKLPVAKAAKAAILAALPEKRYTVRAGDTLFSIAHKFNVAVEDLLRWNGRQKHDTLRAGDIVRILLAKKD